MYTLTSEPRKGREGGEAMPEVKIKRMNINVELSLHNAFKAATAARGENMTDVLLEFIEDYVRRNTPAAVKSAKKGRQ
jgi:hypothetical protein